uniref:Uncharacterized protein n=1 Tax=Arundo donax TaxID=35708 RepID=A0A0A8YLU9_ARUDO
MLSCNKRIIVIPVSNLKSH